MPVGASRPGAFEIPSDAIALHFARLAQKRTPEPPKDKTA